MTDSTAGDALHAEVERIERKSGARALAVGLCDLESGATLGYHASRWFHAASTIKIAILLGVFAAIHKGRLQAQSRVHVRNRFFSAYDGSPFRVAADRDANAAVQDAIGKTMRVSELAHHMIATSSNLATNLLLDLVGISLVQDTLAELKLDEGIDVCRGVEDEVAYERGITNRVTADGLVALLRLIAEERAFTRDLSRQMVDILHAQEFKSGIPARLPKHARVAHKTGEISTVAHDAGIVYLPERAPYILAVLSEWDAEATGRSQVIADVSHAVYDHLHGSGVTTGGGGS